jgi:hypothetical protein
MLGNQVEGEAVGMQLRVDAGGYLEWYDYHS